MVFVTGLIILCFLTGLWFVWREVAFYLYIKYTSEETKHINEYWNYDNKTDIAVRFLLLACIYCFFVFVFIFACLIAGGIFYKLMGWTL